MNNDKYIVDCKYITDMLGVKFEYPARINLITGIVNKVEGDEEYTESQEILLQQYVKLQFEEENYKLIAYFEGGQIYAAKNPLMNSIKHYLEAHPIDENPHKKSRFKL